MSLIPNILGGVRSSVFDPFSVDAWDPFHLLPAPIRENLEFSNTRIDWKETSQAHVFQADLPGLTKDDVKVEVVDERVLQITGERKIQKEDSGETWHRIERSSGKFQRRFRLPENARMDQVTASIENGVLTVTVPKEEVRRPEVMPVQVSGS
ncbi:hypothetical protein TIFTF001_000330 [Ficus carica]|uniref:SHSP domain-containing protein n=1 Tax=Ficus carica TaxID=3494 RepID=A0AA88CNZ4_FICCA|nr:hypothetical protein TIFTF001_000330 [Ficus carica]